MSEKELFYPEEINEGGDSFLTSKEAKEAVNELGTAKVLLELKESLSELKDILRQDQIGAFIEDIYSRIIVANKESINSRRIVLNEQTLNQILGDIYSKKEIDIQSAGFTATAGVRFAFEELGIEHYFPKIELNDLKRVDPDVLNEDIKSKIDMWINTAYLEQTLVDQDFQIQPGAWKEEDSIMIQVKSLPIDASEVDWVLKPVRTEDDIYDIADKAYDPSKWPRGKNEKELEEQKNSFVSSMKEFLAARNEKRKTYSNVDAAVVIVPSPTESRGRMSHIAKDSAQPTGGGIKTLSHLARLLAKDFVTHFGKEESHGKEAA